MTVMMIMHVEMPMTQQWNSGGYFYQMDLAFIAFTKRVNKAVIWSKRNPPTTVNQQNRQQHYSCC
jgi:hypothetical protein